MDLLCRLLVAMEMTPPTESGLYVDGCVPALIGRMSVDRLALIRTVSDVCVGGGIGQRSNKYCSC